MNAQERVPCQPNTRSNVIAKFRVTARCKGRVATMRDTGEVLLAVLAANGSQSRLVEEMKEIDLDARGNASLSSTTKQWRILTGLRRTGKTGSPT